MNKADLLFYIDQFILALSLICIVWLIDWATEFWFEETKRVKEHREEERRFWHGDV